MKHRLLFPLAALFMLIFLCISIFQSTPEEEQEAVSVAILMEPSRQQEISVAFPNQRTSRVRVYDKYQEAISGKKVSIVVDSVQSFSSSGRASCDVRDTTRIQNMCRVTLSGESQISDEFGALLFENFAIEYGPEGSYNIHYAHGDGLQSTQTRITVESPVASIKILNSPPKFVQYGVALDPQPQVQMFGFDGKPLSQKRVIAVSWGEPGLTGDGSLGRPYGVYSDKFAYLSGDVSEKSDANGIATFKNLTIQASVHRYVYIMIVADASSYTPWQPIYIQKLHPEIRGRTHLAFYRPIMILNEFNEKAYTINILRVPSSSTTEGEAFPIQPVLQVLDSSSVPVEGVYCIAELSSRNSEAFPRAFQFVEYGVYAKLLGNYVSNSKTNSSGMLEYSGLKVLSEGNLGPSGKATFGVRFKCGNGISQEIEIEIKTRVTAFILFEGSHGRYTTKYDSSSEAQLTILGQILDTNGNGVAGKLVDNITLLDTSKNVLNNYIALSKNEYGNYLSDSKGFFTLYLNFAVIPKRQWGFLNLSVDGVGVVTQQKWISEYSANSCNYISMKFSDPIKVKNGDAFPQMCGFVSNGKGAAVSGIFVKLELVSIKDSLFPFPEGFGVFYQNVNATSISDGTFCLSSSEVAKGYQGVYYYKVTSSSGCESSIIKIEITNQIDHVNFVNSDILYQEYFSQTITTEDIHQLSFYIMDKANNTLPSYAVNKIWVTIIQTPFAYLSTYSENKYVTLLTTSGTTDLSGKITVNFKHSYAYPGKWAILFNFNGVESEPFTYTTDLKVSAINYLNQIPSGALCNVSHYLPETIQVKVDGTGSLENYVIIATIHSNSGNSFAAVDAFQNIYSNNTVVLSGALPELDYNHFLSITPSSVAVTNSSGIASFTNLTIADFSSSESNPTFFFTFAVGDVGAYVQSPRSNSFYIKNPWTFSINSEFSKKIMAGLTFYNTINMTIILENPSSLARPELLFVAQVSIKELGIQSIASSVKNEASEQLFDWRSCHFYGLDPGEDPNSQDICEIRLLENTTSRIAIFVAFVGLKYRKIVETQSMKVTVGTPLQERYTSGTISIFYKPLSVSFYKQPPFEVNVGEHFHVGVKVVMEDGKKINNGKVMCNFTQYSLNKILSIQKEDLMYLYSTSSNSIEEVSGVLSNYNAELESEYSYAYTKQGYADLAMKFSSAIPGNYSIICNSADISSESSRIFVVKNKIAKVVIDIEEQKLEALFSSEDSEGDSYISQNLSLQIQPKVKVLDSSGNPVANQASNLKLIVVQTDYIQKAYKELLGSEGALESVTFYNISVAYDLLSEDSAVDQIKKLWRTLSSGIEAVSGKVEGSIALSAFYSRPKYADGVYTFTDVTVTFPTPGTYRLIAFANGIESPISQTIIVNNQSSSVTDKVFEIFEEIFVYLIVVIAVIINLKYVHRYFTFILLPFIILEIAFIARDSGKGVLYQVFSIITLCGLLGVCAHLLYREFYLKMNDDHNKRRNEIFREYTYQSLFHIRSARYLESQRGSSTVHPLPVSNEQCQTPSMMKDGTILTASHFQINNESSSINLNTQNNSTPTAKESACCTTIKQLWKETKSLFKPFERKYLLGKMIKSTFYFPQRFIFSILAGFFTLVFGSITIINYFLQFLEKIKSLKNDVEKQLASFLMTGITQARKNIGVEFEDKDIKQFFTLVDSFLEQLILLYNAIKIAFILGCVIAIILFVYSFIISLFEFRNQVDLARSGRSELPCWKEADIADAADFPGLVISNCVIGFIFISGLTTLLFAVLFHTLFWKYLYENLTVLLWIIIPLLIDLIVFRIIEYFVYKDEERVHMRGMAQILEVFVLFTSVLEGVAVSLGRFLTGIFVLIMGMTRIDKPVIPEWVLSYLNLDGLNKSYVALIKMYQVFNHPIAITFAQCVLEKVNESKKENDADNSNKNLVHRSRMSQKFHVIWMLYKCKKLRKLRKQKLIESLEKAAENKKLEARFEKAFH